MVVGDLTVESFNLPNFSLHGEEKSNEPKKYEKKCICGWSGDNESEIMPDVNCPIHGPRAKKVLMDNFGNQHQGSEGKVNKLTKKAKFWIIAGTLAFFGAIIAWRILSKFI